MGACEHTGAPHGYPRTRPPSPPLPLLLAYTFLEASRSHFVPNLTLGAPVVKSLRAHTGTYLDVHLMVSAPGQWVDDFADAGASGFTFHIEAVG